jgi:hypothetical protein
LRKPSNWLIGYLNFWTFNLLSDLDNSWKIGIIIYMTKQIQKWQPLNMPRETKRKVRVVAGALMEKLWGLVDRLVEEEAKKKNIKLPK